jgi:hypothetical protein
MDAGVPLGARKTETDADSEPVRPCSCSVGTDGNTGERLLLAMPIARPFPDFYATHAILERKTPVYCLKIIMPGRIDDAVVLPTKNHGSLQRDADKGRYASSPFTTAFTL